MQDEAELLLTNKTFVSRGGFKLQAALDNFKVDVKDKAVLDVGSSTGGFVDCLLQYGAKKVYAVDTCYGELAWKLRNDQRVVVMERTNILHLESLPSKNVILGRSKATTPESIKKDSGQLLVENSSSQNDKKEVLVDLITIDAGWTKLELVLPVVKKFLKPGGIIIALLKPHYESPKQFKGGVVPEELVEGIKNQVLKNIENLKSLDKTQDKFKVENCIESPILGGAGNKEYLLYLNVK